MDADSPAGDEMDCGGTPYNAISKRSREEELDAILQAGPPAKRTEMTPCTPCSSPYNESSRMCTDTPSLCKTPLQGGALAGTDTLALRWGSASSLGPRRWPRSPALLTTPVDHVHLRACTHPRAPHLRARSKQEDRCICKLDDGCSPHACFGVFDGHGGYEAAEHCAEQLHENIVRSVYFPQLELAVKDAFLRTDIDYLTKALASQRNKDVCAGAAAVVALVTGQRMLLAHAGDCRAVLVRRAGAARPFEVLTRDHTAEDKPGTEENLRPDEAQRVRSAGGDVEGGYVHVGDNTLPMTRAFGNTHLKVAEGRDWRHDPVSRQIVTALPDVSVRERSADDLALVLASDGLFGSEADALVSSEMVANITRSALQGCGVVADAETKAARRLVDCALTQYSGSDNTTVIVISLEPPPQSPLQAALDRTAAASAPQNSGPVPLERSLTQCSQQTDGTAPAHSPGRAAFGDTLLMPFAQAYPPREDSERSPSPPSPPRLPGRLQR